MNKLKKTNSFHFGQRNEISHRANCCHPNWTDRQADTENHNFTRAETYEQEPLWE